MNRRVSELQAWRILQEFAREVEIELGGRLQCVTAFGSLVNHDYIEGFSDFDQVVVVRSRRDWDHTATAVRRIVRRIRRRRFLGKRLHEGYVVPRTGVWSLDRRQPEGLVPRDVVDLILHGRTLAGTSIWSDVQRPTDETLRAAAVAGVFWIPERPPGLHALLNCIFMVAGTLHLCATGEMTWTKGELVRVYGRTVVLPFRSLLAVAGKLRRKGDLSVANEGEVFERLLPQYADFLRSGRDWLRVKGLSTPRNSKDG